jgi:crossover junction endodeoxyribonuclease RuvC
MFDTDGLARCGPGSRDRLPSLDVLGIDPGVSRCGYGAVRRTGGDLEPLVFGVLRTDPASPLPERLAMLQADLEAVIDEVQPGAVAVERVLFSANTRTAMSVGQASGLALAIAARRGIPVHHYSPNEVKLAVVGYGAAEKVQVQAMVTRILNLAAPPDSPDAADALALAIAHAWQAGAPRAGASSPKLAAAIDAALAKDSR